MNTVKCGLFLGSAFLMIWHYNFLSTHSKINESKNVNEYSKLAIMRGLEKIKSLPFSWHILLKTPDKEDLVNCACAYTLLVTTALKTVCDA